MVDACNVREGGCGEEGIYSNYVFSLLLNFLSHLKDRNTPHTWMSWMDFN